MTTASIVSAGPNYRHQIKVGSFELVTDEPKALGGQGAGPAPFDYYLASLAACTAITLKMFADLKGWNLGQLRIDLKMTRDEAAKAHIRRTIYSDRPLSDEQWSRLLDIASKTPVTKVMREGAEIVSERGKS